MFEFSVLMIPLAGTTLGAGMVFLLKDKISPLMEKAFLGFASGVMIAASVWSLLIPAIDMAEAQGKIGWLPAAAGFLCGVAFLLVMDMVIPHMHMKGDQREGLKVELPRSTMLLFAVTLHNVPEGMAIGVALAGALSGGMGISRAAAITLAMGIALQNFPEGAIISMPLKSTGMGKFKAFMLGALSGAVEPLAGFLTLLFVAKVTAILPYALAFAAGAMIYVVVEELIPESQAEGHSNAGTIAAALGFTLMMVLDVALG